MTPAISACRPLFPFPPSLRLRCARVHITLTAALLLVCAHSGCVAAGGYTYSYTKPVYVKGSGATGTITCTFAPKSPVKPKTITFSAGGRSARVPGTIRGLSRAMQYVQFCNTADGAVFPASPEKIALKPSPYERDARISVTVK